MLPPFIIEQIRKREEAEKSREADRRQPRLELPLDLPPPRRRATEPPPVDDSPERGVVILDLG